MRSVIVFVVPVLKDAGVTSVAKKKKTDEGLGLKAEEEEILEKAKRRKSFAGVCCLDCECEISVAGDVVEGDCVVCPDCEATFAVVGLDPVVLDYPEGVESDDDSWLTE